MLAVRRLALAALACACTPTGAVQPVSTSFDNSPPDVCLLGDYRVLVQQRMVQDDGETALLEDQRIGAVPVLFEQQRRALRDRRVQDESGLAQPKLPNAPQTLLMLVGEQVTERLDDLEYVDNDGAKPTQTRTATKEYTFFLATAAWNCEAAAREIDALKLPRGQVGTEACVPPGARAGCSPVDLE